mmetsp:Transcript_78430/g.139038  ORF Transcript_78430/g.139038 Transcript_78430/m.139038 type:complete len:228 (+) Transcript_78430:366-1049(+)
MPRTRPKFLPRPLLGARKNLRVEEAPATSAMSPSCDCVAAIPFTLAAWTSGLIGVARARSAAPTSATSASAWSSWTSGQQRCPGQHALSGDPPGKAGDLGVRAVELPQQPAKMGTGSPLTASGGPSNMGRTSLTHARPQAWMRCTSRCCRQATWRPGKRSRRMRRTRMMSRSLKTLRRVNLTSLERFHCTLPECSRLDIRSAMSKRSLKALERLVVQSTNISNDEWT